MRLSYVFPLSKSDYNLIFQTIYKDMYGKLEVVLF